MLLTALEILVLFVIPVLLLYYKVIHYRHRFKLLLVVSLLSLAVIIYDGTGLADLGLRTDNLSENVYPYFLFTLIATMITVYVARLSGRKADPKPEKRTHLLFLFIPLSFWQEILYRGFLIPKLGVILPHAYWVILANALLFMILHTIYSERFLGLFIAFIGGVCFSYMYILHPNTILLSLSHSILNFVVVLYGFFFKTKASEKRFVNEFYER
ncbi:MAG: CPBP family glutamic-type intramembrane protease [Nanobdellota archaeon]